MFGKKSKFECQIKGIQTASSGGLAMDCIVINFEFVNPDKSIGHGTLKLDSFSGKKIMSDFGMKMSPGVPFAGILGGQAGRGGSSEVDALNRHFDNREVDITFR